MNEYGKARSIGPSFSLSNDIILIRGWHSGSELSARTKLRNSGQPCRSSPIFTNNIFCTPFVQKEQKIHCSVQI